VRVAPVTGADCHSLEMTGGYCDIGGMYIGPNVTSIAVDNFTFFGNSPNDAITLDGTVGSSVFSNIQFSGTNAKCFHALNSAKNFRLSAGYGQEGGVNTVGAHIEAGCDHYIGNTVGDGNCTTALTQPSPGANSVWTHF
jgi:hypothetical protein